MKIKNIDNFKLDKKKNFRITAVNTFKRVDVSRLNEIVSKCVDIVDSHPEQNPSDSEGEEYFKSYKMKLRTSNYKLQNEM
uniref:Uncharacterized protein n=1 Tax=Lepeophtheirus salmonis TaxID=72036 RepID=A0A0K2V484_LEPSM